MSSMGDGGVALCIAGQLRDHRSNVFPSLNASLLAHDIGVDVFIDTWDTLGQNNHHSSYSSLLAWLSPFSSRAGNMALERNWSQCYKRLVWQRVEHFPANGSRELHDVVMPADVADNAPLHYRGTLPNSWKMWGCSAAISDVERRRSREYEAVVKIRPDGQFWTNRQMIGLLAAMGRIIRGDGHAQLYHSPTQINASAQVSDKYAVGRSSAMHYYLGVWNHLPQLWRDWRAKRLAGLPVQSPVGERLMHAHMQHARFPFGVYHTNRR